MCRELLETYAECETADDVAAVERDYTAKELDRKEVAQAEKTVRQADRNQVHLVFFRSMLPLFFCLCLRVERWRRGCIGREIVANRSHCFVLKAVH